MHLASLTAAVLAATAFAQCIDAWTITTSDATRSEDVVGAHQEFTKTWTVSGSSSLDAIRFAAAGPVFIDVDSSLKPAPATETPAPTTETPASTTETPAPTTETPAPTTEAPVLTPLPTTGGSGSGSSFRGLPTMALDATSTDSVVAKIVFTGNCTDLLNVFEVIDHDGEVKVHFKNQDYRGHGYILTQVYVADADSLRQVTASGDSSVYISEHVIATGGNDTEVSLKISGDGSVFVTAPSTDVTLKSLDLKISGDGTIQFNTSSLTVSDSLDSKISGDGTIAVLASNNISVNNTLTSKISGDGDIFVLADSVDTFSLESGISGEGSIVVARNGSAVSQDISISGEGTVSTGSIVAADTKLKLSGEGDVLVQTTGTFQVPSYIDGKVQYVGATPQQITDGKPHPPHKPKKEKKHKKHGFYFGWWDDEDDDDDDSSDSSEDDEHILPNSVTRAPENVYKTYEVQSVPAREPVFLILTLRQNWWGEDANTHFLLEIFGVDIGGSVVQTAQSLAARVKKHSRKHVTGAIGLAGVALVAVGVAVHKLKTRSRRREYQPLLQTFHN